MSQTPLTHFEQPDDLSAPTTTASSGLARRDFLRLGGRGMAAAGLAASGLASLSACQPAQPNSQIITRNYGKREPVPAELIDKASIPTFPNTRFFADRPSQDFAVWLDAWTKQRRNLGLATTAPLQAITFSGGSSEGAFGGGLMVGWGQRGDRPVFDLVSGISAGAIVGASVILGHNYDKRIQAAFTSNAFSDILALRPTSLLFGGPSLSSANKLATQLEAQVDDAMIDLMGRAYFAGRRFMVITSNLDQQRPVAWDITGIAASRHPSRYALVRKILLASAALPGLFPPVRFSVVADGQAYDEFHVDGAVTQGLYLFPGAQDSLSTVRQVAPEMRFNIYMVINGPILPTYDPVRARALNLANTSLQTLLKNRTAGDVKEIFRIAQFFETPARLTFLPQEMSQSSETNSFKADYMNTLFAYGQERGLKADLWYDRFPLV